jgi:hypothetical protein
MLVNIMLSRHSCGGMVTQVYTGSSLQPDPDGDDNFGSQIILTGSLLAVQVSPLYQVLDDMRSPRIVE